MAFATNSVDSFAIAACDQLKLGTKAPRPGQSAWIDYPGPAGTVPQLSFADVENGNFAPAAVKGKLVVVGPATRSFNIHPRDQHSAGRCPGAEIQAAAVATVLDDLPLRLRDGLDQHAAGDPAPRRLRAARRAAASKRFMRVVAGLVAAIASSSCSRNSRSTPARSSRSCPRSPPGLSSLIAHAARGRPSARRPVGRRARPHSARRRRQPAHAPPACAPPADRLGARDHRRRCSSCRRGPVLRNADLATVDTRFTIRGTQADAERRRARRHRRRHVHRTPTPEFPFKRTQHAKVIDNLVKAGREGDRLRHPVHRDQRRQRSRQRAGRRGHAPQRQGRAPPRRRDAERRHERLRSAKVLTDSTGVPAGRPASPTDGRRVRQMLQPLQRPAEFADRRGATALGGRKCRRRRATVLDRLRRPRPRPSRRSASSTSRQNKFDPAAVKGKIVVVGGDREHPAGHPRLDHGNVAMPGPEIHANGIATALEGFPLLDAPGWLDVLLIIALGSSRRSPALRLRACGPRGGRRPRRSSRCWSARSCCSSHAGWINHVVYAFVGRRGGDPRDRDRSMA